MQAFIISLAATLVAWLADSAKGIVGRVLVGLGIGVVTAGGLQALLSVAMSYVLADGTVATAIHAVGVDWFISTLFAAITTRATLSGLSSDQITFWTMRGKIGT